jgi:ketosteroid isomerase-like protein
MGQELLKSVARALEKADFEPLYKVISDDVRWKSAATIKGFFRFGGEYKGRTGVAKLISEIGTDYTIRAFTPKEIVSNGDVTWGLFWVDLLYKPAGGQVSFDCAIRWRLSEGKVVEHQAFIDTAAMLVRQAQSVL